MGKTKKTVAVVVCTYNGEKYLKEQIDSIINQTYPVQEIIIQDDGSTDNTVMIAEEYAQKYENVSIFKNERNVGFNANFESAAMRATADFIAIADQDDVWYPEKIAKQVEAIGEKDICFCCHDRGRTREQTVYVTPQYSLEALLFTGFAGHTMLLRRDFVQNHNNWISYIHYDWSLAINAQLQRGIVRIDEPLNWHRTHDASAIAQENKTHGIDHSKNSKTAPYTQGYANYSRLQKKENWQRLYQMIYERSKGHNPLAHRMAGLMRRQGVFALLQLCAICAKHRKTIYYNEGAKGIMGIVRGFFYPFIFTYNNVQYDL